jgi:HEAT repeat protein
MTSPVPLPATDPPRPARPLLAPIVWGSLAIVVPLLALSTGAWYWPRLQLRISIWRAADGKASVVDAEVERLGGGDETAKRVIAFLEVGRRTEDQRRGAYCLLERSSSRSAIPGLVMLAEDRSSDLRDGAIELLSDEYGGDLRALNVLLKAAADRKASSFARTWALVGLAQIDDERAAEGLVLALQDEDQEIRDMAVLSIGERQKPDMVARVRPLLKDKRDYVRRAAEEVLRHQ